MNCICIDLSYIYGSVGGSYADWVNWGGGVAVVRVGVLGIVFGCMCGIYLK